MGKCAVQFFPLSLFARRRCVLSAASLDELNHTNKGLSLGFVELEYCLWVYMCVVRTVPMLAVFRHQFRLHVSRRAIGLGRSHVVLPFVLKKHATFRFQK